MGEFKKIAVSPPVQKGGSQFTPEQLMKIGTLAGADAKIEMTPFKQLYVQVPIDQHDAIKDEFERSGLEVNPAGFVTKALIACNFCKGEEAAGLETAKLLNQAIAGIETPTPMKVGYAGCALGTSEPLLKDIGVVKMKDTFDIYVGGEPKGLKVAKAKLLCSGVTQDRLAHVVTTIIDFYKENAKSKEKFSKFVDRMTLEQLQEIVA
ncbi:nitrite reductase [Paenibacillus spongiae]|uniref:Nitrite reductase n=1 Tax=Paenibacillus spongiae TaxID=2909671 RepID=A0ABY5S675_9BACL|nr:nitrite reductase [Paenibacillus spongiae]UVI29402.1 nitrite reductase [Paenibacillus spongiae]